jgi:hypothetical protein
MDEELNLFRSQNLMLLDYNLGDELLFVSALDLTLTYFQHTMAGTQSQKP